MISVAHAVPEPIAVADLSAELIEQSRDGPEMWFRLVWDRSLDIENVNVVVDIENVTECGSSSAR